MPSTGVLLLVHGSWGEYFYPKWHNRDINITCAFKGYVICFHVALLGTLAVLYWSHTHTSPLQIKWSPHFCEFPTSFFLSSWDFQVSASDYLDFKSLSWELCFPRTCSHQPSDKGDTKKCLWSHAHWKYPHASPTGACITVPTCLIPSFCLCILWHRVLHWNFPPRIFSVTLHYFITSNIFWECWCHSFSGSIWYDMSPTPLILETVIPSYLS